MTTTLTYTALEIVTDALREAGVVAVDYEASAEEEAVALKRLNMMLKAMQGRGVTVWKETTASIALTDATASYTISTRPLTLETVTFKDTNGLERPLVTITRDDYSELPDKDTNGQPVQYWYSRLRESGVLFVWPVMATASGTLEWYGRAEVDDVTAGSDTVDVPAEHYEALHYGLALRLCLAFQVPVPPLLAALAEQARLSAEASDRGEGVQFLGDYE